MRTFDSKKGKKIVDIVIKNGPIGFNELQRKIGFSSRRTLGLWLERLDVFDTLDKDNQGKIVLTKTAKIELRKNGTIIIPEDSRRKKRKKRKIPITFWDKKELIRQQEVCESAYIILVSKAAGGDYRYRPTLNSEYGNPSMFDIRTGKDQNYSAYHVPGVGLSDFKKTEGPAMLDRRLHVGHMELFAYIKDFTKSKIQ